MNTDRFTAIEQLNKRNQTREQFDKLDLASLDKAENGDLAWIQSCFDPEDPQHIYIQNLWNARLLAKELNTTIKLAIAGMVLSVITGICGFIGGLIIAACSK